VQSERRRNPSRERSNSTQSHIRLESAAFYQLKQLWVFGPPGTAESGPKNLLQSSRRVVKEKSLIHTLYTHNYAVAFSCSYKKNKSCKCFEPCHLPSLSLSLVLQHFHTEKEERGLIFLQVRGKRHIIISLDFNRT